MNYRGGKGIETVFSDIGVNVLLLNCRLLKKMYFI